MSEIYDYFFLLLNTTAAVLAVFICEVSVADNRTNMLQEQQIQHHSTNC